MNLVICGPKGAGKSAVANAYAERTGLPLVETDRLIESIDGRGLTCREIMRSSGEAVFRELERQAAEQAASRDWHIVVTGGGTLMDPASRRILRDGNILIWLMAHENILWDRATQGGVPPWLEGEDGPARFAAQNAHRAEVIGPFADVTLDTSAGSPHELAVRLDEAVAIELGVRGRVGNTFGDVIRVTSYGESHGKAIGCILDGIRPGIEIDPGMIQAELDRRRPGQSKVVTQRKEPDSVEILSGVFEGKSTGAPIGLIIYNQDQDSTKYEEIRDLFRPGHADFTFYKKYGIRDHRGGGRSSARETAMRVAAGAVAKAILKQRGVSIRAHAVEIAGISATRCDYDVIESNPVRCADSEAAKAMEEAILTARKERDSVGGVIRLDIDGVPAGLGDPVFGKLDARLTYGIMTIGAIKGVEVGLGFAATRLRGSQDNDNMQDRDFLSNNAGGITGGISTGQRIVVRVAVKPTASIASPQRTIDLEGNNREIVVGGRHDPCIVPRAVPVIEHVAALVLLDAWEIQERLRPGWNE